MNNFTKLSSSSSQQRLNSHVTVVTANSRDIDCKFKLEIYQRKMSQELTNIENKLKRMQKWNHRADKNNIIKQIYNNNSNNKSKNESANKEQLTPSVEEWLKMNMKEKNRLSIIFKRKSIV